MIKKIALAAAVASLFSLPAFASLGSATANGNILQEGSTASRIINSGHPHTYSIHLEQPATVSIASRHFPGADHSTLPMSARLIDGQGNTVREVQSTGGDFSLQEALQAGQYQLVVSGKPAPGGESWDAHRYSLDVTFQ